MFDDLLKGKPALLNSKINLTNSSPLSAGLMWNTKLELDLYDTFNRREMGD